MSSSRLKCQIVKPGTGTAGTAGTLSEAEVQQVIKQIAEGRLKPSIKTHNQHASKIEKLLIRKSVDKVYAYLCYTGE